MNKKQLIVAWAMGTLAILSVLFPLIALAQEPGAREIQQKRQLLRGEK